MDKKGSNEAGKIWTDIAQSLKECEHMNFKEDLSQRVALLQCKFKEKKIKKYMPLGYPLNKTSWMCYRKKSYREET